LPETKFIASDGQFLPFRDNSFDRVLIRDILHHILDAKTVIEEAKRVLRPQGELVVIEANGRNLLVKLFGLLVPAEKLVKRNRLDWLLETIGDSISKKPLRVEMKQPFPISRALLHYQFGLPWLTKIPGIRWLLDLWNKLAEKIVPKSHWFYMIVRYVK